MEDKKQIEKKKSTLNELVEYGYTERQLQTIANTVARGATLSELHLFLSVAKATGLNPFLRQIHFVKRNTKHGPVVTIQTGIDGFRSIADRPRPDGESVYGGSDQPVFDWDGDAQGKGKRFPVSATSTVYRLFRMGRNVERTPISRTAYWDEYYPGEDNKEAFMWRKMPRTMLGKCAEALALRAAFPMQLSGVYVHEEMDQAGGGPKIVDAEVVELDQSEGASELNEAVEEANEEAPPVEAIRKAKEDAAVLVEYGASIARDFGAYFGENDKPLNANEIRKLPEDKTTWHRLNEGMAIVSEQNDLSGFASWLKGGKPAEKKAA